MIDNINNLEYTGETCHKLYEETEMTWPQIGEIFGKSCDAVRKKASRWLETQEPTVEIQGITATDNRWPDEEEVYERACHEWEKTELRLTKEIDQYLTFSCAPVGIAFVADLHCGGKGVNYPRMFQEAEIIKNTPGLFLFVVGDLVDNFVIGNLMRQRLNARLSIRDEWALVRRYLRVVGNKLVGAVAGNHESWTLALAGIDYFKHELAQINQTALYDKDDVRAQIRIGSVTWPLRVRHQWQGRSIYNSTHGIERAAKWDQDFIIGVGAHDHVNGACRTFNIGGEQGLAVKAGTYKVDDAFARRRGFPKSGPSTAVVVIFNNDPPSMTGFTNLEVASDYLNLLYRGRDIDPLDNIAIQNNKENNLDE